MVSAKFHIRGDVGDWMRVRVQEELYSHGLEGNIMSADEHTLVVVVEGDKAKIKRLYTDLMHFMPAETGLTEIVFSLTKPTRAVRIKGSEEKPQEGMPDNEDYLREIERKMTQIDLKLNKIISMLECNAISQDKNQETDSDTTQVSEETTNVFATVFGEQ
jgi:hypothetical protein